MAQEKAESEKSGNQTCWKPHAFINLQDGDILSGQRLTENGLLTVNCLQMWVCAVLSSRLTPTFMWLKPPGKPVKVVESPLRLKSIIKWVIWICRISESMPLYTLKAKDVTWMPSWVLKREMPFVIFLRIFKPLVLFDWLPNLQSHPLGCSIRRGKGSFP